MHWKSMKPQASSTAAAATKEVARVNEGAHARNIRQPRVDVANRVAVRVVELIGVDCVGRGVTRDVAGVVPDVRPNQPELLLAGKGSPEPQPGW